MMSVFQQIVADDIIQVRGYTTELLVSLERLSTLEARQAIDSFETSLWIKRSLPSSCNLSKLKHWIGSVDVHWRKTPMPNVLRELSPRGFGELVLSLQDRRRLRNRFASEPQNIAVRPQLITGYLNRTFWL